MMLLAGISLGAQQPKHGNGQGQGWRDRVKAEKIAYLTNALELTPAEAEVFWPVYNIVEADRKVARDSSFAAWRRLSRTGNPEKDLNAYLKAQQVISDIDKAAVAKFKKVLPIEKVAKLYVAEENFRRDMIHKFQHGGAQGGAQGCAKGGAQGCAQGGQQGCAKGGAARGGASRGGAQGCAQGCAQGGKPQGCPQGRH